MFEDQKFAVTTVHWAPSDTISLPVLSTHIMSFNLQKSPVIQVLSLFYRPRYWHCCVTSPGSPCGMGNIDFWYPVPHFQHNHGDMRWQRTVSCVITAILRNRGSGYSSNTPYLPPSTDLSEMNILFYLKKRITCVSHCWCSFHARNTIEFLRVQECSSPGGAVQ